MSAREKIIIGIALVLIVAAVGAGIWIGRPGKIIETAAPEVKQDDGSIIVERAPDAKAKPKQKVPKGSKVERTGEITVQGGAPAAAGKPCPPVTIDTTLVRNEDGSQRVIVSSPDGPITRAIDIPVETAAPPPEPKLWAAGLSYDPIKQTGGLWVERDIMRVRLGAEVGQARVVVGGPAAVEFRIKAGVTF